MRPSAGTSPLSQRPSAARRPGRSAPGLHWCAQTEKGVGIAPNASLSRSTHPDRSARKHAAKQIVTLTVSVVRSHEVAPSSPDPARAARRLQLTSIEGLTRPSWQHRSTVHARDRSRQFPLDIRSVPVASGKPFAAIPFRCGPQADPSKLVPLSLRALRNLSCPYRNARDAGLP